MYGSAVDQSNKLRDGAKLRLTPQGYLPDDASGQTITGFNESWWLGLGSMHTLFAREHNVLCDELRSHYPSWGDERIFQTARLIVSAAHRQDPHGGMDARPSSAPRSSTSASTPTGAARPPMTG